MSHLLKIRKYYFYAAVLFSSAQAQFAFVQFKNGKKGWDLVSIPFFLILGFICCVFFSGLGRD